MTPLATRPARPSRSTQGLWPARRPLAAISPVASSLPSSRIGGSDKKRSSTLGPWAWTTTTRSSSSRCSRRSRRCSRSRRSCRCRIRSCSCSAAWRGFRARRAGSRVAARPRPRRPPAAAPLRRGLLHLAARPAHEHPADRPPCDRARARHHGLGRASSRTRSSSSPGPPRSRSARSSRRPTRSPPRRSRAGSGCRGGSSRSSRASRSSTTRRRSSPIASRSAPSSRARSRSGLPAFASAWEPWAGARRPRRRLGRPPGSPPARRSAGRDHDLADDRLLRLPAGRGAGRVRRPRGGDRGRLPRLAHTGADDRRGAAAGRRRLGDRHVRPQRRPLRPDRAAAPRRSSTTSTARPG